MTKGKKVKSIVEVEENGPESGGPEEEASEPQDELEAVCSERDEYFDLLTRKQAEFENYRRRVEKEKAEIRVIAQSEVIRELLTVIDACESGLDSLNEAAADDSLNVFVEGYELLLKQLLALLERFEVTEVAGVGAIFDPNVHEAVVSDVSPDHQEGEILDEFRKGYLIRERLLRPSQVRVAVQPEE
jgi:molecular chaperone GrpE